MTFAFGVPVALWLFLLCPILLAMAWRNRYPMLRSRRVAVTLLRVVSVVLVILSLAELRLAIDTRELAVAVVTDTSASVSGDERRSLASELGVLQKNRNDVQWSTAPSLADNPHVTDLGPDISIALASLPVHRIRRILLATDGRQDDKIRAALLSARALDSEIDILPLGARPPIDRVAVSTVALPRFVHPDQPVDVAVTLHASERSSVTMHLEIDYEAKASREVVAEVGSSVHTLTLDAPETAGAHAFTVSAELRGDRVSTNNTWRSLFYVRPRPRVLLLHEVATTTPALGSVLSEAHFAVESRSVREAPVESSFLDRYAAVVLDEVDPGELAEDQQIALRTWVDAFGGGLVTITGGHAVLRTPEVLRAIEPIETPRSIPEPRPLELILAIDRSGSMEGHPLAQARAAGIAALRALLPEARLGTVAFSDEADLVQPPVSVGEHRTEAEISIGRITSAGGTNIAAAIRTAGAAMSHDDRYIHHVVLLSDGESDYDSAIAAARVVAAQGISITAITLGEFSPLMREVARIGRGRYHVTQSAGSLSSLFVREAQYRRPPANSQERFQTEVLADSPLVAGIDFGSAPPLLGYALSDTRSGATTILSATHGYPLLAHWYVGEGQVASFTSSTTGGWADEWRTWTGFRSFWTGLVSKIMRARIVSPLTMKIEPTAERETQRLTVQGPTTDSEVEPIVSVLRRPASDATPVALRVVGPGIWQADIATQDGFVVLGRMPTDPDPTVAAAVDNPFPAELRSFLPDHERIADWALLAGGRVLRSPREVLETVKPKRVQHSLSLVLIASALGLYLLSLLVLRWPEHRNTPASRNRLRASGRDSPVDAIGQDREAA